MAKFTTIKKKDDNEKDEHTLNASDFLDRLVSSQRQTDQKPFVPNTEQPK